MGLLFKQLRKLHEAHEARYVLSARRTLSFNTNSDEILELMRTNDHEQSHYEENNPQGGVSHRPVRTQNSDKRVHWAVSCSSVRKSGQVDLWDETAKHMIAVVYFVMYCTLPGPWSHVALLDDLTKDT